ncbi:MAG: zf-HC2 domain-containing protein [candidate division Zixibacteria bacterium]|nr:zf-HC2 domain-containing protein [candidate division Zixibacteria bacterium]
MTHQEIERKMVLSLYGELDAEGNRAFEAHLAGCDLCREEFARLSRLHRLLSHARPAEPSAPLLDDARRNLRAVLRYERTQQSVWQRLRGRVAG